MLPKRPYLYKLSWRTSLSPRLNPLFTAFRLIQQRKTAAQIYRMQCRPTFRKLTANLKQSWKLANQNKSSAVRYAACLKQLLLVREFGSIFIQISKESCLSSRPFRLSNIEFHLVAQGVGKLQPHTSIIVSADLRREQEFHNAEHLPIVLWFRRENCSKTQHR